MRNTEDARVKKTKARLLTSFRTLLTEKNFEDITINEICDVADIRRATFYKHFTDKYAFFKFFVGSLRRQFDAMLTKKKTSQSTDSDYYVEYLKAMIEFLSENEAMVNNALESSAFPMLIDVIKEKNYEDTCDKLRESERNGLRLPASIEITATMMTGAVAEVILRWFRSGKSIPKSKVIEEASAIIIKMSRWGNS